MGKYNWMITIQDSGERENIFFDTELDSKIHFEDLKKDSPFDMFLSVFDAETKNYTIVETFLNSTVHNN